MAAPGEGEFRRQARQAIVAGQCSQRITRALAAAESLGSSAEPWSCIKELINRGGEKISPERVEEVLTSCPGVTDAKVFGIPDDLCQAIGADFCSPGLTRVVSARSDN